MTSRDDLRIGDAEREEMMAALREHYVQGRITHQELDERLDLTLHARTGGELAKVAADLPDPRPAVLPKAPQQSRARHHHWHGAGYGPHRRGGHGPRVAPVLILLALAMLAGMPGPLMLMLVVWIVFAAMSSAHRHHHRMHPRP